MSNEKEGMLMQQEEKHGFVPKLRFPEFRVSDAWKFVPLNKLAKRCNQKNRDGVITKVLTNSAEYGVVDQRDFFDKDIATQGNLKSYYVVKKGDYVYNPRISAAAPVGPISKNKVATGVMSPLYSVFRFGDSNNDFYAYYFKTAGWHQYMRQASSTGARHDRMAITNDDFMAMPLPASTPEEQQKIADCLSSLDDLIRLEAEKLDAIMTHKKGLMQQIFPAEGENLPKLRFPEFREDGEWGWESIGDFGQVVTGSTPSTADPTLYGGGIPFVSPADISELRYVDETKTTLTAAGFGKTRPIRAGSVLFVCIGSTIGKIAQNVRDCATNQQINAVIPNTKHSDGFVYFALSNASDRIALLAGKQAVPIINKTLFSSVRLLVPSLPEQRRISDCLTSLDELIAAQAQKLDTLKTHKKGLMQQLFPQVGEADA
ncbi:restriction endonuclease subunit S [Herbaspirillum aquaticum]|uniref:restriction endonuclease subunit S n=1 Tax=Herbaspirillum aquaticum TaxID=568783 RepID=UPI0024DEF150|nr:restriction endonuclease subunit S [Herbaspirillum aquaticum]